MNRNIIILVGGERLAEPEARLTMLEAVPWAELQEVVGEAQVVVELGDALSIPYEPGRAKDLLEEREVRMLRLLCVVDEVSDEIVETYAMRIVQAFSDIGVEVEVTTVSELSHEELDTILHGPDPVVVIRWRKRPVMVQPTLPPVYLRTPMNQVFVGGWARVPVVIDPNAGLAIDDLVFDVVEGDALGRVSMSRDETYTVMTPEIMLLAGHQPGRGTLRATHRTTGQVLSQAPFDVTEYWPDDRDGPTFFVSGKLEGFSGGSTWGGGTAAVQNYNIKPAKGTKRLAIILVDTKSERYTNAAAVHTKYLNEAVNGVTSGGVTRSAAHYIREVSYGEVDLSAQVYGPVHLDKELADYLATDNMPLATADQAVITAADKLIDYKKFDIVVMVYRSVDAKPVTATSPAVPRRGVWPCAWTSTYSTSEGTLKLGSVAMPQDWGSGGGRTIHETLSHELGHTLGLGDLYKPVVPMPNPPPPTRNPGSWELMGYERHLPHYCMFHRLVLGWVKPSWVKTIDFSTSKLLYRKTFKLSPIEKGKPPAKHFAGIEIRIADGKNWYCEYRVGQTAHIGDRNLPTDQRVLITDGISSHYSAPISRPAVLLVPNDPDGDGSVLNVGQDLEATDQTNPVYPTPFELEVKSADQNTAEVQISYGIHGRPDPSIRPWPAGPDRQWQSPDIEIKNAKSAVDKKWFNVPWVGHENRVIAKVKNRGTTDAPKVRVNFFVKNLNVGGGPETFIGSQVRDIAADKTVEFEAKWSPPKKGHYCVDVRIPLYQIPTALSVVELTEHNNVAQTNYTRFISKTASPPTREVTYVDVGNPYDHPIRVYIEAGQSNPLYRTYVQHKWLTLAAKETRRVQVMFEFAPDEATRQDLPLEEHSQLPNNVDLMAFSLDREVVPSADSLEVLGGTDIQVVTGRATQFEEPDLGGDTITGSIVCVDNGEPVSSGIVIASVQVKGTSDEIYATDSVEDGSYQITLPNDWEVLELEYLPADGYGECISKVFSR